MKNLNNMKELARVLATGRKVMVQQVAAVNKVPYYVEVSNPERVYTKHELWLFASNKKSA